MLLERPRQDELAATRECRESFELRDRWFIDLFRKFNAVGSWRCEIDTGHIYFCRDMSTIFGIKPTDGPIDLVEVASRIHPADLAMVMEVHEASAMRPMSYQKIYRVASDGKTYRWYCSIGDFHAEEGTGGYVKGFCFSLPPSQSDYEYIPNDQSAPV